MQREIHLVAISCFPLQTVRLPGITNAHLTHILIIHNHRLTYLNKHIVDLIERLLMWDAWSNHDQLCSRTFTIYNYKTIY